jgi:hypothetical protein
MTNQTQPVTQPSRTLTPKENAWIEWAYKLVDKAVEESVYRAMTQITDSPLSDWTPTLTNCLIRVARQHREPAVFLIELASDLLDASAALRNGSADDRPQGAGDE